MRINCPFCGERELSEFTYRGDANPRCPITGDFADGQPVAEDAFADFVYMRENPAGDIDEHWYHGGGCRAWLVVNRNTLTHVIASVRPASGSGAGLVEPAPVA